MSTANWLFLVLMVLIGLFGLNAAAHANDQVFSIVGWILFLFAIFYSFGIIRRATGEPAVPDWDGG
jgi:1,4-dihydroxy-2-naphthoate octaprenyltransferase